MKLLIRADASPEIGAGHVMRCLALAQACQDAGGDAEFLSMPLPTALEERLQLENFTVRRMHGAVGSSTDAEATVRVAQESQAAWIVIDGYAFDDDFQTAIKQSGARLLVIDDTGAIGSYSGDLVLNQNPQANEDLYPRCAAGTDLLLGIRYALLRREFLSWRYRPRNPGAIRRLLVTLGGADPANATLKVIRAIQQLRSNEMEVIVLVGPANSHRAELEAAVQGTSQPIELRNSASNMPELMNWADCAISAAGSTCWELAFMGVPNLLIVLAENQRGGAEALQRLHVSRNLGWHADLEPEVIAAELHQFLKAKETRDRMSERGRALIDGGGAARVIEELHKRTLTLRMVRDEDCDLLFEWANEPAVRGVSFNSEPITKADHVRWFSARLSDPHNLLYIACDAAGTPVGQIRFDRKPDEPTEAIVSVSVAPNKRGAGLGQRLIRKGVEKVFRETAVRTIHAFAKSANERSVSAFENAGFINCGCKAMKGHAAIHLLVHAEPARLPRT